VLVEFILCSSKIFYTHMMYDNIFDCLVSQISDYALNIVQISTNIDELGGILYMTVVLFVIFEIMFRATLFSI
jgi:hypothetical protein